MDYKQIPGFSGITIPGTRLVLPEICALDTILTELYKKKGESSYFIQKPGHSFLYSERRLQTIMTINISHYAKKLKGKKPKFKWDYDEDIPRDLQIGEEIYRGADFIYKGRTFDRSHLFRALSAWIYDKKRANAALKASYLYTNCLPHFRKFNGHIWLERENYVFQKFADGCIVIKLPLEVDEMPIKLKNGRVFPVDNGMIMVIVYPKNGQIYHTAFIAAQIDTTIKSKNSDIFIQENSHIQAQMSLVEEVTGFNFNVENDPMAPDITGLTIPGAPAIPNITVLSSNNKMVF